MIRTISTGSHSWLSLTRACCKDTAGSTYQPSGTQPDLKLSENIAQSASELQPRSGVRVWPRAQARGCIWLNESAPEVRKISKTLSPLRGLKSKTTPTPGLRPGLHSGAAPRLNKDGEYTRRIHSQLQGADYDNSSFAFIRSKALGLVGCRRARPEHRTVGRSRHVD